MKTSVYLAYDQDGALLYIGITGTGVRRLGQHRKGSEWWASASTIELEHFATRKDAEVRERELILAEKPPFNRQHRGEPRPPEGLLSLGGLARAVNLPRATVSRLAVEGNLPVSVWLEDSHPCFDLNAVNQWIKETYPIVGTPSATKATEQGVDR